MSPAADAVMRASPCATALTRPADVTDATPALDELHLTLIPCTVRPALSSGRGTRSSDFPAPSHAVAGTMPNVATRRSRADPGDWSSQAAKKAAARTTAAGLTSIRGWNRGARGNDLYDALRVAVSPLDLGLRGVVIANLKDLTGRDVAQEGDAAHALVV